MASDDDLWAWATSLTADRQARLVAAISEATHAQAAAGFTGGKTEVREVVEAAMRKVRQLMEEEDQRRS